MIADDRVTLRPPRPDDQDALGRLRNDVATQTSLMALPRANSARRVDDWVEGVLGDPASLFFVVADRPGDAAVGFVQLRKMDLVHCHAELGIGLLPAARGLGYGGAAVRLIEAHARQVFRLRKVVLQVLAPNVPAVRLYEKCGYARVGLLRQHFYHAGAYHDVVVMEHLLEDSA